MLGQEVPIGTGSVDIIFDEEKFIELSKKIFIEKEEKEEVVDIDKQQFIDILCKPNNFVNDLFDKI